MINLEYTVRT